ncbi:DUF881 domain-containing protein [Micromonospora sp. WMMA1998]|uniref:DUF881 domain-containing protein n=1 Tax=Micromonospora sp. WMMA1998 TaxID=3015167 RepID=UPI00248C9DFA|nr:DUF881 domain-containing protein [Micromonospora sp. WMMA1998]WBC16025.1 DUF881 domain-containing protein [Micromonospora sp. WMMA1998]
MTATPPRDGDRDPSARVYAPDFLTELFRNPLDPGYGDAAARRAVGPVSRVRAVLGRPVSLVVLLVIGFLFAVAYRETMAEEPSRATARAGLIAEIKKREAETDRLTERAERLREEVGRQRDAALSGSQASRLRNLEAGTGLGRVRGDGVVVRLTDAPQAKDAVTGEETETGPQRVLYSDLQKVANALWSAGAEAVAINGQRLTATTTIRQAGEAILVDYRPVTSPYEVQAIGPGSMRDRFDDSRAAELMRYLARTAGLSFAVKEVDDLTLSAAPEPQLRYAGPPASPSPGASGSGVAGSSSPGPSGSGSPSPSGGGR